MLRMKIAIVAATVEEVRPLRKKFRSCSRNSHVVCEKIYCMTSGNK